MSPVPFPEHISSDLLGAVGPVPQTYCRHQLLAKEIIGLIIQTHFPLWFRMSLMHILLLHYWDCLVILDFVAPFLKHLSAESLQIVEFTPGL